MPGNRSVVRRPPSSLYGRCLRGHVLVEHGEARASHTGDSEEAKELNDQCRLAQVASWEADAAVMIERSLLPRVRSNGN